MRHEYKKPELYLRNVQIEDILSSSGIVVDDSLDIFDGVDETLD